MVVTIEGRSSKAKAESEDVCQLKSDLAQPTVSGCWIIVEGVTLLAQEGAGSPAHGG